jgi:hypothetical protein
VTAILLAACSSGATPSPSAAPSAAAPSAAAPSAAASGGASQAAAGDPKTAKTTAEGGGVDAICAAGKTEGQVTLIATPNNWANYGQMITDFQTKYGIKVQSDKPDANSQDEINQATQLAGTGRQPDIFDLGSVVAAAHTDMYAPYQPAGWADIPAGNKEPTGLWINNYTGFESIAYDTKLGDISKVADLKDPKFHGKVALNGDPLKASAGFNGVVMASLANGGSADNIAPGVDFFKGLADSGNLLPVDPTDATVASGQTPVVIDWTYNQGGLIASLAPKGTEGRRPVGRGARCRVLQRGDQQGRGTSRGGPLLGRVRVLGRRAEHLAEGLRPAGPAPGDAGGRHRRRGSPGRRWRSGDPAGPADAGADRHGHEVPDRQLEVHRDQVVIEP